MEVSIKPDEKQNETPANPAAEDSVSRNKNAAASSDRESGKSKRTVREDPRAARKLARKKRMKASHRRRLKASYAKG